MAISKSHLKVPKREIFDRSDFPDFYTIKSSWVGDLWHWWRSTGTGGAVTGTGGAVTGTGGARPALVAQCVKGLLPR
jgi:hypothetical protein